MADEFTSSGKPLIYGHDVSSSIPTPISGDPNTDLSSESAALITEREGYREYDTDNLLFISKKLINSASNDQNEEIRDKKLLDQDKYTSFSIVEDVQSIQVGEQIKLNLTTDPVTANTPTNVTWICESVSGTVDTEGNPTKGRAFITSDNVLTGVSEGRVKITAVDTHKSPIVSTTGSDINAFEFEIEVIPAGGEATPKEVDHVETTDTFGEINISKFIYTDVSADGGESVPQVAYSQVKTTKSITHYTDGTSRVTSSTNSTITTGATLSYAGSLVNATTGVVTAESTDAENRAKISTVTLTVSLNGKTATKTADVYQAGKTVAPVTEVDRTTETTYGDITISKLQYGDVPAEGGVVSPTIAYSQTKTQTVHITYSDGTTQDQPTTTTVTSGATITYSGTSVNQSNGKVTHNTAASASTRTKITTVTATVSLNGKTATKTADVYQAAAAVAEEPAAYFVYIPKADFTNIRTTPAETILSTYTTKTVADGEVFECVGNLFPANVMQGDKVVIAYKNNYTSVLYKAYQNGVWSEEKSIPSPSNLLNVITNEEVSSSWSDRFPEHNIVFYSPSGGVYDQYKLRFIE